jgi:hypothetical protein
LFSLQNQELAEEADARKTFNSNMILSNRNRGF